jgi:DnaJ-domain-containing protein 1
MSQDFFLLLDEPRRPWLDPDLLKAKFLQLSTQAHPDRVHESAEAERMAAAEHFSALNTAYQCLRVPKDRLLHLLALERTEKPPLIQEMPPELMEGFMRVGDLCRSVDRFLADREAITSPLVRVQWFEKGMEWSDQLSALSLQLRQESETLEAELRLLNPAWENAPAIGDPQRPLALPLPTLERIHRALSFLAKWSGQLQERVARISF